MTRTIDNPAAVDTALQPFRDMVANDGFLVSWTATPEDRLVVRIDASSEACADCLVPQPVMEAIIAQSLDATPFTLDHVVMPAEH